MSQPETPTPSTPAQKVMKQTSKTAAELQTDDDAPVGPNDGPTIDHGRAVSKGDAPVGESENDGSSPYEQPHLGKKERSS